MYNFIELKQDLLFLLLFQRLFLNSIQQFVGFVQSEVCLDERQEEFKIALRHCISFASDPKTLKITYIHGQQG